MTPDAARILSKLAGRMGPARDVTLSADDVAGLASVLAGMGPGGVAGAYKGDDSSCSCNSGGLFGGYGTAGLVEIISTGPGSIATGTMDITGKDLPAGSILVLDSNTNGRVVTDVLSDGITNNLGAIGASFELMKLSNNNAPGLYLQIAARKTLKVQVAFNAASVAGDKVFIQVLGKGGGFLNKQSCAVS